MFFSFVYFSIVNDLLDLDMLFFLKNFTLRLDYAHK